MAFLILAAWTLLLVAWVISNPPFAAPDETDHYTRAVGISQGHLIGKADPAARIGADARQVAWTRQAARLVTMAGSLDPLPYTCATGAGEASAACLGGAAPARAPVTLLTAVGNYQPLPYLLPAAVMRASSSAPSALRLARGASALLVLLLLALALFALYDASSPLLSVLGLLLAATPMVLFCGAILNGSGMEIASAIAFLACLLRVMRTPTRRGWLLAAGAAGAVFALSRPASPLWLVLDLGVLVAWAGARRFGRSIASNRAWRIAAGLVIAAVVLNRIWEALYGSHAALDSGQLHAGIVAGVHEWWRALPELVGKFGYINVKLPLALPVIWLLLVALVALVAAAGGSRRERLVLAAMAAGLVLLPPLFYALFTRPTGFGLQGRQLLPVAVALPLIAGETCYRARARLAPEMIRLLSWLVLPAVGIVQVAACYTNAKRFAVGVPGPVWFLPRASWSPPLGWGIWLGTVLAALLCFIAASLIGAASQRTPPQRRRHAPSPDERGTVPASA